MKDTAPTYAILTKTFAGDLALFERLAASIDRHMPEVRHYVLVDRRDNALFARFASPSRRIVECEKLLPLFHPFSLGRRRLWWRSPFMVVRGWIQQQLAKIAFVAASEEDAIVIVDSETVFLRPLRPSNVFTDGRANLYRREGAGQLPGHIRWHDIAARALGLPKVGYTGFDYISSGVVWSPTVVRSMLERIERETGRVWHDELARHFRFSEYTVYGVFADRVPGSHGALLHRTEQCCCLCSFDDDLSTEFGIERFLDALAPHHDALLIQSNLKMDPAAQEDILDRAMARVRGSGVSAGG